MVILVAFLRREFTEAVSPLLEVCLVVVPRIMPSSCLVVYLGDSSWVLFISQSDHEIGRGDTVQS